MEMIINALAAALTKMGLGYIFLELIGLVILLLVFFNLQRVVKLQSTILKKININYNELDPPHLYSKLNRFEYSLEAYEKKLSEHQHEETRLLHKVSTDIVKVQTILENKSYSRREDRNE
ncbi:MAG: hypothetical protein H8D97_00715 [Proteobacteria bacterium]|nr:hypothetical protein [Pseudomonadota bacterium]